MRQAPRRSSPATARAKWLALLLVAGAAGGSAAWACNVPVFRYALERWHPDPYRATLFHRGPLTADQQSLLARLADEPDGPPVNVTLRLVDVDELSDDADRELLAEQATDELPWLAVQYPRSLRNEQTVWGGALDEANVSRLVASPQRSELIRRLIGGQTAIWLLLECGQSEKDDAVAAQLEVELARLSQKLTLPELTASPQDDLLSDAPLRVEFSLLRVPRDDPAEAPLVGMLLHAEEDLLEFDEPMVFPVFGRGRALLPLIGPGITEDNIHASAAFLVGACSCEIKDLNPGFDLLLAGDWDFQLFGGEAPEQVLATRAAVSTGEPEFVAIPAGRPEARAAAEAVVVDASPPDATVTAADAPVKTTPQPAQRSSVVWIVALAGLAAVAVFAALRLAG